MKAKPIFSAGRFPITAVDGQSGYKRGNVPGLTSVREAAKNVF